MATSQQLMAPLRCFFLPAILLLGMIFTTRQTYGAGASKVAHVLSPPALTALSANGQPVNISAVPGWRVVYFWGASCPCVTACERYSLVPLANMYKSRVSFFAVASDGWDLAMPRPKMLTQIASHHLPYPVLLDTQHTIARTLHAKVTPQTFVLDPEGRVVFHGMPDDSRRFLFTPGPHGQHVAHTYLSVALAEALAGNPVTNSPLPEAGCIVAW
jgi:peroxiredoxin